MSSISVTRTSLLGGLAMAAIATLYACQQAPALNGGTDQQAAVVADVPVPLSDMERAQVTALLEQADAEYEAGQWLLACETYNHALAIEPGNKQASDGLNASLARLDRESRLVHAEKYIDLVVISALAEFDAGYQRSLQALEADQFELAKGAVLQARATLLKNREYISTSDFESRDSKAAELLDAIDRIRELHVRSGG
jgi:hypothetical protein